MTDLEQQLEQVNHLRDKHDYEEAWNLTNRLCNQHPDNPQCWRAASYLASHQNDPNTAVATITKAISLLPDEPSLYFKRSRDHLESGSYLKALSDADRVVELSLEQNSTYYLDTALFYKAEALFRLGQLIEAKKLALRLPAGTGHWLGNEMRTREDILSG